MAFYRWIVLWTGVAHLAGGYGSTLCGVITYRRGPFRDHNPEDGGRKLCGLCRRANDAKHRPQAEQPQEGPNARS